MDLRGIILFWAFLAFSRPAAAVYGGYEVTMKDYPHHVAIELNTNLGPKFISSGAILSQQIIVTVASVLDNYWYRPTDLQVRAGSERTGSGGTTYKVAELHRYFSQCGDSDVAILKLAKPATWSQTVHSIDLPRVNQRPQDGETSFVTSWGRYEDGIYATKLRHAAMTSIRGCNLYRDDSGSTTYNTTKAYNPSAMLCLSNKPARGTCDNDDGAPLVSKGLLVGLSTRWGFGCNNSNGDSLFVDLSYWEVRYFLQGFL